MIDSHTHIYMEEFDSDRNEVINRAVSNGVGAMILPNVDLDSIDALHNTVAQYPSRCHAAMGLHPTSVTPQYAEHLALIRQQFDSHRYCAVGEIGIDLYWDDSRRNEQIEVFETQIEWARELGLPLCIHSRNAFDDLYACLQRCRCNELTGVFHCFSGTKEQALQLMQMEGFVFGIGGVVTYKKSDLPDVLSVLPLERIVLETDSPYLAPVPRRGRRNESSYIPFIAQRIAEIYGTTVERVAEVTSANAERLFSI